MARSLSLVCWLLIVGLGAAGCSTHANHLREIRTAYFAGDLKTAEAKTERYGKRHPSEADVLKLERATILLSEGKANDAEQLFRQVRDRFDYLEQKDLKEGALAMLTDDQQLAYAGEDYEKVLVRVFLALSNLMKDGQDAEAYSLQVTAKQQEIIDKGTAPDGKNYKKDYKQVAVGAYLHAALREATHDHYDDAARSFDLVCHWEPEFAPGRQDLLRTKEGRHSAPGNGVLYVFTLVGRGPYKEEKMELASTAGLLVADRILSYTGKHTLPPNIAPVKIPKVVTPFNEVQAVRVAVDGQDHGQTATITDVGRMAVEQGEAALPLILGRAIARRVVKKAAIYGAKEAMRVQNAAIANVALDVAGVAWEATESADTRCWGLLPAKIQVLRVELPAGSHQLLLQPTTAVGSRRGGGNAATIEIADGRNTYVLANFPTERLAGQIVASH